MTALFLFAACGSNDQNNPESSALTDDDTAELETIDSSEPISDQYDPIEIARILVAQEMEKQQVAPTDWEITEIDIYSYEQIDNIADYDKPVGEMRVVWVTGDVHGAETVSNIDLKLYKLDGDDVWYISEHWGVLGLFICLKSLK